VVLAVILVTLLLAVIQDIQRYPAIVAIQGLVFLGIAVTAALPVIQDTQDTQAIVVQE
jgi:hypothetical protein